MHQFQFQNSNVSVTPTNDTKQWFMTVEQVAEAYAVARKTIVNHMFNHSEEIRDGVERGTHILGTPCGGPQEHVILYREGVIKLGFFIRSPRAAAFRQFATDLIINHLDNNGYRGVQGFEKFMLTMTERMDNIEGICRGLRDEVDDLQAIVGLIFEDGDRKLLQSEVKCTKQKMNCDGRKLVGILKSQFNTNSIYGNSREMTTRIVRYLKQLRGDIKVIEGGNNGTKT